ncbi:MAG: hypothetical protein ACPGUD_03430 [Parashewanella sp.]
MPSYTTCSKTIYCKLIAFIGLSLYLAIATASDDGYYYDVKAVEDQHLNFLYYIYDNNGTSACRMNVVGCKQAIERAFPGTDCLAFTDDNELWCNKPYDAPMFKTYKTADYPKQLVTLKFTAICWIDSGYGSRSYQPFDQKGTNECDKNWKQCAQDIQNYVRSKWPNSIFSCDQYISAVCCSDGIKNGAEIMVPNEPTKQIKSSIQKED